MAIKGNNGNLVQTMRYRVIASGGVIVSEHRKKERAEEKRDAYNKKHPNQPAMVCKI